MGRFSNLEFDREEDHSDLRPAEVRKDERYYFTLGGERFREGRFENALRYYSRALEYDARLAEAWLGQVQSLLELEEPAEARVWADKGLESFRNHADLLAAKGVASGRLGETDAAMALVDAALAEKGETPYRWRARGEVLLLRGDRNHDHCFGKALASASGDWFEPLAIGRVYLRYDQVAPSMKFLEVSLQRHAGSAFAWETIGRARERLGLTGAAGTAYRHALSLDSDRPAARQGLARMDGGGAWASIRRAWSALFRGSNAS